MVSHKDVVLAVLGASAGLAGLVLVFLGLVASATSSFPGGTKPAIVARARRPVYAVLSSFCLGAGCVGCCVWWLVLLPDHQGLYVIAVCLFLLQLALLVISAFWAVRRAMWG